MSRNDEGKKKINAVLLDSEVHAWTEMEGTRQGLSPSELLAYFALENYLKWEPPNEKSHPDVRMAWNDRRMRRRLWRKQQVEKAAAMYAEDPTQENAELLAEQCLLAGISLEEAKAGAENDPFTSIIAYSSNGTAFGECCRWLPRFILEHNDIPQPVVCTAGKKAGFDESMITRARRRINSLPDSEWRIETKHCGAFWRWSLVKKGQEEQQQEESHYRERERQARHK